MQTRFFFIFCCVLQLLGFTASAPAGLAGQSSSAALTNPFNSTRSSFLTLLRSNATNSDPAICHVANTRTVLIIRFFDNHPIDPAPTTFTINAAIRYVERAIQIRGDGWLPDSNDPFRYDLNAGIAVAARSAPDVHLTWGVLGNALRGLLNCVAVNEWYEEARFEIFNGDSGHVGDGALANAQRRIIAI